MGDWPVVDTLKAFRTVDYTKPKEPPPLEAAEIR
jgi:hypothetical protein